MIGQVPEEWLNRKVFHAFQAIGSGTTPPSKEHEWYQGGTIPWITTSELRENTVVKTKKCVTSDAMQKFSALKIFPAGSLAIAMYGATIGRLGFLGIPATTNQACCVLSGERDLNIQFLYYWLMAFRADIVAFFSEGGGQPNINQEVIASLRVPSPAPDEQATIVATLDRETARIDALVEKKTRFIELLKEKRQALITHAVTKGLDRNAKMKDSGIEWIGQVPEHWKVARVKRLASLRNERRNDVSTDTIYIGLEDVEAGSGQYKPTNGSSRQSEDSTVGIFYEGDVLYGKLRPYLRKAIISEMAGCCSTEFLVLRAEKTEPRWLQEWLLTPDVTHQIVSGCEGAKMPRADWGHIGSIEVVYPDQPEQAKILTSLDRETARIDALISKTEQSITLLKERRAAFITAAVTGQIDLRGKQ